MSFPIHHTPIDVIVSRESSDLGEFVSSLPSVKAGSTPLNWFLSWPHASTMYSALANFEKVDHVYYRRYLLEHADGGNNTLDFATRTTHDLSEASYVSSGDRTLPPRTRYMTEEEIAGIETRSEGVLVVLVHGLAGGSHETYIRSTVTSIFQHFPDDDKVSVVAFNARGCARSKVTSKMYWNAGQTDDIASAIDFLCTKFPNRKIMAVGFSLGANILTDYLARFNDFNKISLAISVSNPWNLLASSENLESYWLGRVYSRKMASSLQKLFQRHAHMLTQHNNVDAKVVLAARNLPEFDTAFTANAFGFESAAAYYTSASSSHVVHHVNTNLIIINAKDDPMAPDTVLPYTQVGKNKHLCLLASHAGGHIGWYGPDGRRWFIDVIVESLDGLCKGLIK